MKTTQDVKLWMKTNLFSRWYNSLLTVAIAVLLGYLGFHGIRFLLITSNWEPVRENLTLFMLGRFPRAEQWRILTQIALLVSALGMAWGLNKNQNTAVEPKEKSTTPLWIRWWALELLVIVLLILTRSLLPLVFVLITLLTWITMQKLGQVSPQKFRGIRYYFAGIAAVISYQVLNGFGGTAWIWTAVITAIAVFRLTKDITVKMKHTTLFAVSAIVVSSAIVWAVYGFIDIDGVSWEDWSGFHLNLTVTVVAIALAFPLGIVLALGRRSSLPIIKYMSVSYIELIRGVPLIGLLYIGDLFLGFFLTSVDSLSEVTRAIVVLSIFTSAYLAEIFRGGLRAVPKGQLDAAKAVGLGPVSGFIWVIFPQVLRATIPALVGQSISLFKDTSLLTIISIVEILRVRQIVHTQNEFQGIGIAETLIFVSFAFWAISYTMSKESQILETKLGVGIRSE